MKIIIIEDEKRTARDLAKTLQAADPDVEILAMLHSAEEAETFLKTQPTADLIFSDIELGDGLSFGVFEKLKTTTPIVFCTAFDHYALDAFKTSGVDYILKPFNDQAIEKTLAKFRALRQTLAPPNIDYGDLLEALRQKIAPANPSVIILQGDKIVPLNGKEIALFFMEDDYAFAHTFDGKKHILSQSMEALEKTFAPDFFRANRQYLVNRKAVKDASLFFNRKILVHLTITFSGQILVGKLKTTSFMQWLAER